MWLSTDNTQNKAKPLKGVNKNGEVRTLILSVSTLKLLTIARHSRHMTLTQTLHPRKHTVARHSRKYITKATYTSMSNEQHAIPQIQGVYIIVQNFVDTRNHLNFINTFGLNSIFKRFHSFEQHSFCYTNY